jgi:hypothetical protein
VLVAAHDPRRPVIDRRQCQFAGMNRINDLLIEDQMVDD